MSVTTRIRTIAATPELIVRCRYLRRNDQRCTAEAADPAAEVLLCTKHLARAIRTVRHQLPGLPL